MKPTKEFLEGVIASCRKEQERLKMEFERQEGVARFCQKLIEDGTFAMPEEK